MCSKVGDDLATNQIPGGPQLTVHPFSWIYPSAGKGLQKPFSILST